MFQAVDPEDFALVTKAASRDLLFEGGPQPWALDPGTHFRIPIEEDSRLIEQNLMKQKQSNLIISS